MGCLSDRCIVHAEVIADRTDHHFARVETDTDLNGDALGALNLVGVPSHRILHLQSGIARAHGVVLVRQRRTKERHDAVAHDVVYRALVPVNGCHHALHDALEKLSRLLRVTVRDQLHGSLEVREQHGDLLTFALDGAPGREDLLGEVFRGIGLGRAGRCTCVGGRGMGAGVTELRSGRELRPAIRARPGQRRGAFLTEPRALRVGMLTARTRHAAIIVDPH